MLKQEQQQKPMETIATDNSFEWSYIRVAEAVTTNVVSAVIIGLGAVILGVVYGTWVLVLSALHTPDGLIGILGLLLLGATLMLVVLVVAIIAWVRGMSSATFIGMLLGAMIGAAIGAAIDSGKWNDWIIAAAVKTQEQQTGAKQEASNP